MSSENNYYTIGLGGIVCTFFITNALVAIVKSIGTKRVIVEVKDNNSMADIITSAEIKGLIKIYDNAPIEHKEIYAELIVKRLKEIEDGNI